MAKGKVVDEVAVEDMGIVEIGRRIVDPRGVVVERRPGGRLGRTRRYCCERGVIRSDVHCLRIGVVASDQEAVGEALLNLDLQAVVVGVVAGLKDEDATKILRVRFKKVAGRPEATTRGTPLGFVVVADWRRVASEFARPPTSLVLKGTV